MLADKEAIGSTSPEQDMANDMFRVSLVVGPLALVLSFAAWGWHGLFSSAYALALVLINFLVASRALSWAGRISATALMAAAMASFIFDLVLLTAAVIPIATKSWVNLIALGLTLIVSHLVLVLWEARRVSATLAFDGLRPRKRGGTES